MAVEQILRQGRVDTLGGNSDLFFIIYCIGRIKIIIEMPQRKIWSAEEDRVLKFLIEQRGLTKWSQISRVMQQQFTIVGRNGKQCRERYHNHLDKNINNSEWTLEEENRLFDLQDDIGNKWALISNKLPGRTDNCVKNHFYSKLRKSLRKINKKIHKFLKKEYREIKTTTLYRIIETMENRNKLAQNVETDTYQLCRKIKNQLRNYEDDIQDFSDPTVELAHVRSIIEDIALFDKEIKKNPKKTALKSSAKLSEQRLSYSKVSSTKSVCDDQSESCSNSEMFSSSSFTDHRSFGSQKLNQPLKIFRSQSIESESEISSNEDQILYKSANSMQRMKSPQKVEDFKPPALNRAKSISSQHSKKSGDSDNDNNRMYMWGEQSLEMRVTSPRRLTIEEKMEMDVETDKRFYGQMEVESSQIEQKLIKDFSGLGLGLYNIPKLGKSNFD